MAHSEGTRVAVQKSYIYERLPLKAASEKHDVSYNTARSWKKQDKENGNDWDRARNAARMSEGGLGDITVQLLEDFAMLFQTTVTQIKDSPDTDPMKKAEALSRLSDAYAKTMKAAGNADPKISELAVAMKVIKELSSFIRERYPQHVGVFAGILEPFGVKISEAFG